jgi:L-rhamnose mutarotase
MSIHEITATRDPDDYQRVKACHCLWIGNPYESRRGLLYGDGGAMKRFGMVIGLKPEAENEYREHHTAVWPEVLETIKNNFHAKTPSSPRRTPQFSLRAWRLCVRQFAAEETLNPSTTMRGFSPRVSASRNSVTMRRCSPGIRGT